MTPERWQRIEQLYLAAAALNAQERAALLAGAEAEVRAEVEAMLAQPDGSNLLDRPAWDTALAIHTEPPIAAGTRLGQYQIEAEIGAGGMAVVYRARDSKLQRPVAIKFLSDEIANAPARRRFQREAQMASSLNHPHILTVYDTGEFEGRQYLVTEFIDGGTLKNWCRAQARSWEEIVELLTGVADGLGAAHEAGILHRDIKPENILVTARGYAKLADFGLAKLQEPPPASAAPTMTADHTRTGMIVGTAAYMSPEQASGDPLDARSDVFSFGVVLYEMLAGRRPFRASTNLELLQQVIHTQPEALPSGIPETLRELVMRAIEKKPGDRFQSMREVVTALRRVQRSSRERQAFSAKAGSRGPLRAIAAVLILIAAAAVVLWYRSRSPAAPARVEYVPLTNFSDSAVSPALSPDGRMLAFIRGDSTFVGHGDVWLKLLPDGDPAPLTHDGGTKMGPLSFSPDGSRIAYTSGGWQTSSVAVLGGEPALMLAGVEGLSWTKSDALPRQVMYSSMTGEGIRMGVYAANESRSQERVVYMPADTNRMAHRSFLSPNGEWVIVVEMGTTGWLPCRLVRFDGSTEGRGVGPSPAQCTDAAWSPDGRFMYFSANTGAGFHTWRQRFPDGAAEQVTFGAEEEQGISFAPDGKSFVTSVGERQSTLWVHDTAGARQVTFEGYAYLPAFSADGGRLFYLQRAKAATRWVSGELWTLELGTGKKQRLLPGMAMEGYSVSPDERQIVFISSEAAGGERMWLGTVDGSSPPRRLADQYCMSALFGPDGEIYFVGGAPEKMYLQKMHADGSGLQKIIADPAMFLYDVSPDAKWVAAWVGSDIGVYAVSGGRSRVVCKGCGSAGGEDRGVMPPQLSWSRDGKELFLYAGLNGRTYAAPLKAGQVLPPMPASGVSWQTRPPDIAGVRTFPEERTFVGPHANVYAYARLNVHRNIYRIAVP